MSAYRKEENYWKEKIEVFLHDPPHKVFSIERHKEFSEIFKDAFGIKKIADQSLIGVADRIAAGMDRTFLPDYREGVKIDYLNYGVLTHPTGKEVPLFRLKFPSELTKTKLETLTKEIKNLIEKDITQLSDFSRFHYLRHVLFYRLAEKRIGGLTWEWEFLPADSRIPDHSIWQHCALASALYSCYKTSSEGRASLMVFSITPVQDFIAKARKLRDYFSASLILSWLSAEGIKAVILNYGSDHILYPSPVGQPFIEYFLDEICNFPPEWNKRYLFKDLNLHSATLPNKFVFLIPAGEEEKIAEEIKNSISSAWEDLGKKVEELVKNECFKDVPQECLESFEKIFERQIKHFWSYHWCAMPLLDKHDIKKWKKFLNPDLREKLSNYLQKALDMKMPFTSESEKFFYPLIHATVQMGLAGKKLSPEIFEIEEPGIKCHLHPELEALRFSCVECKKDKCIFMKKKPDHNTPPSKDPCWKKIRENWKPKTDFKLTERLSAIGLIKRLVYRAIQSEKKHSLNLFLEEGEKIKNFPSTTEVAIKKWFEKNLKDKGVKLKEIAEIIHRQESRKEEWNEIVILEREKVEKVKKILEETKLKDINKYYAIVLMDGDRMGKLLGGNFPARWWDVLHPSLKEILEREKVSKKYLKFWNEFKDEARFLSPSVHAAISQALAYFSLYTVPNVVKKYGGHLIYAGGDDVCAIFPVDTALSAVLEVAELYNKAFVKIGSSFVVIGREEIAKQIIQVNSSEEVGGYEKLLYHLGPGEEISISGSVLIVHHKWPLRAALQRSHILLNLAKDAKNKKGKDRNALAIELHRRSGERRTFISGFRDEVCFNGEKIKVWRAFKEVIESLRKKEISSSFIYKLAELKEGIKPFSEFPETVKDLIFSQMKKRKDGDYLKISKNLGTVLLGGRVEGDTLEKENLVERGIQGLLIAKFLGAVEE